MEWVRGVTRIFFNPSPFWCIFGSIGYFPSFVSALQGFLDVTPENLINSFLHFGVCLRLVDCFRKADTGMSSSEIFPNFFLPFDYIDGIFLKGVRVSKTGNLQNPSCLLLCVYRLFTIASFGKVVLVSLWKFHFGITRAFWWILSFIYHQCLKIEFLNVWSWIPDTPLATSYVRPLRNIIEKKRLNLTEVFWQTYACSEKKCVYQFSASSQLKDRN